MLDCITTKITVLSSRNPVLLTGTTVQSSVDCYGQKEIFDTENQLRWDPDRLSELGIVQDENTIVTKRIVMTTHQASQQRTLLMKLFSNYDEHGHRQQELRYMRQEGQELLKLDRWINVPIMLQPDGTELESLIEDHQVTIP